MNRVKNMRLGGLLAAALMAAPAAQADKVPRAEQGNVPLIFAPFGSLGKTTTVKTGDVAWTEQVRPAYVVRIADPAPARLRPNGSAVPAGARLFGYQLSSGMAYCAVLDLEHSERATQCFRDFDNDGQFDGGYVTDTSSAKSRYFSSFVHGLVGVPKLRYEATSPADVAGAEMRIVYAGMKKGAPRFQGRIEKDKLEDPDVFTVVEPGVCEVYGVRMRFAETADGLTLEFLSAEEVRGIQIYDAANHLSP